MKMIFTVPEVTCVSCKRHAAEASQFRYVQVDNFNNKVAFFGPPVGWMALNVDTSTLDHSKHKNYFVPFVICPECYDKREGLLAIMVRSELA